MFEKQDLQKIENSVREFFEKTSFLVEVKASGEEDQTVFIKARTDAPQILIGENGQTLAEIQRLLKLILKKRFRDLVYLDIDINDYKAKKTEYLKDLARSAADEVSLFKREKVFPPMPAFERRIIHLELAGRADVVSESVGEEPERKVVIKPAP